ncbi:response regulator [bacterium]|jgi:two-component system chemotaxis response regulator CheY|nr:response regulator [bacterium]
MKKVAFVDDSKAILTSVEFAVKPLVDSGDIEFIPYIDEEQLLKDAKLGKLDYDLLFTDINMPQINGLELSNSLKKIENLKKKPIIALTTEDSNEMKLVGKKIGIAGWIVKPFNNAKIVGAIKKILSIS